MLYWMATDPGLEKDHNEDAVVVDEVIGLYSVADGMGGHGAGDVASNSAIRVIAEQLAGERELLDRLADIADMDSRDARQQIIAALDRAVREANRVLHTTLRSNPRHSRMGTTLCAALVRDQQAIIVNVGDSRAYLMRDGGLHLLTEDHSLVQEQVRRGMLTEAQAAKSPYRNILIRSLGPESVVDPDIVPVELRAGDRLLLCTDGISDPLDQESLTELIAHADGARAVELMIERANGKGGGDNASALLLEIENRNQADGERSPFDVDPNAKIRALWQLPMFHHLEYAELVKLMAVTTTMVYQPGEVVIREHEPGGTFLVIIEGVMQVMHGDEVLTELHPGEQVGELALLDGSPRSATVIAAQASSALIITNHDFYELIRREPVMATKLLWRIGVQMAQRIRELTDRLRQAV